MLLADSTISDAADGAAALLPGGRHFLGWDAPALPAAAAWLRPYGEATGWDLSALRLVVATGRARRRLMELLVTEAGGALLGSPTVVTLSGLADGLFEPGRPIAGDLEAVLARTVSLREAPPAARAALTPRPPADDDWPGWWALAGQLHEVAADLAGHRLTPAAVEAACEARGIELPHPERWAGLGALEAGYQQRLAEAGLADRQAARLEALGEGRCACDQHLVLIATADLSPLAYAMLEQVEKRGRGSFSSAITSLVHAPEEHAEGFDAFGGLRVPYWQAQPVPIEDDQLWFVDKPTDQGRAAAMAIGEAHQAALDRGEAGYAADEVSVGLGDESQAPAMQRTLDLAGLPARYGPGKPIRRTRPALLVEALGRFADGRRFDDFAELLRHPDIETYLGGAARPPLPPGAGRREGTFEGDETDDLASDAGEPAPHSARSESVNHAEETTREGTGDAQGVQASAHPNPLPGGGEGTGAATGHGQGARGREHWLTLLDRYAREHLQGRVDGGWLGRAGERRRLKRLWAAIAALLPLEENDEAGPGDADGDDARGEAAKRPLPHWSQTIAAALEKVYGAWRLDRRRPGDDQLARALETLGETLREQAALAPDAGFIPQVTLPQAITLTARRLASRTLPEPAYFGGGDKSGGKSGDASGGNSGGGVELMGYLDLAMDDAVLTVLASLNEGCVPGSVNADPLLPDGLRASLGMADNARRYARDLLRLRALLASRPAVTLIAARRTAEGEPLTPSRLLLACDDATLQHRLRRFYEPAKDTESATSETRAHPPLLVPGERDQFHIPAPPDEPPRVGKLRVTAFADYLACPYRFYLRHVRGLDESDDASAEMDPLAFGVLAHEVLHAFGQSEIRDSTDPATIGEMLDDTLDRFAQVRFGETISRATVLIQLEQMRYRLARFAEKQAALASEGWRIVATERDLQAAIEVDGEPFTLTGRIDRIDHHPDHGYRILDYKTAETAKKPEKTHLGRDAQGEPTWVDLQLPLYRDLAGELDLETLNREGAEPGGVHGPGLAGAIALGYFNLPKEPKNAGLAIAEWEADDLAEAMAMRDWVIRQIRAGVFWPPADPPAYADAYTRLCGDETMQRGTLIETSKTNESRRSPLPPGAG